MTQSCNEDTTNAPTAKTITKKPSVGSLYDAIVYIKVGPNAVEFGVHRGLLCYQSAYFRTCFTGNFMEARAGTVTLDDEDPKTFKRFNAWLYTGNLMYDEETMEMIEYGRLFELYVFAEKRLIPGLQNACIDAVIHKFLVGKALPHIKHTVKLWDNTPNSSPMRKLVVDQFVANGHMVDYLAFDDEVDMHSKDFLASLVRTYYTARKNGSLKPGWDFWARRCQYHTHEDGSTECHQGYRHRTSAGSLPEF